MNLSKQRVIGSDLMSYIKKTDPELYDILEKELDREELSMPKDTPGKDITVDVRLWIRLRI